MGELMRDYFYGTQKEEFTFYQIPKILFTEDRFRVLSNDAKILYGLMLDRMSLSVKNHWMDKKGRVYIIFTLEQIMKTICCGKDKGVKILNELEQKVGLIERVKQGFGKPTLIYLKNFIFKEKEKTSDFPKFVEQGGLKEEVEQKKQQENLLEQKKDTNSFPTITEVGKTEVMTAENQKYQGQKNRSIEVGFSDSNNTNYIIKTNNSNTNLIYLSKKEKQEPEKEDKIDEIRKYQELIKKNIEYPLLLQNNPYRQKEIEELVFLILEVVCGKRDTIWIAGAMQPIQLVKGQFLKLNAEHIQYVLDCLHKNPVHIRNIKAYLLTTLFNAPKTLNQYYRAMVNYDMHSS